MNTIRYHSLIDAPSPRNRFGVTDWGELAERLRNWEVVEVPCEFHDNNRSMIAISLRRKGIKVKCRYRDGAYWLWYAGEVRK